MFTNQKTNILSSSFALLLVLGATVAQAACPFFHNSNHSGTGHAFSNGGSVGSGGGCGVWSRSWNKPAFPPYDRPFPLGQVSDAFFETQQTNAEAADFILYDYEFVGETATLNPMGRDHMIQIARRLPHVPFPVVIEMSAKTNDVKENQKLATIDEMRRANVVMWLQKFYADDPTLNPESFAGRVVIAPDFNYQMRADEAIANFNNASMQQGNRGGHGGFGGY